MATIRVQKQERYSVECSEHGHVGQAYFQNQALANVIAEKHLESQHSDTPPDVIYDDVVVPIRDWAVEEMNKLQTGTSVEYDNIFQIIEEVVYRTIGVTNGKYQRSVQ